MAVNAFYFYKCKHWCRICAKHPQGIITPLTQLNFVPCEIFTKSRFVLFKSISHFVCNACLENGCGLKISADIWMCDAFECFWRVVKSFSIEKHKCVFDIWYDFLHRIRVKWSNEKSTMNWIIEANLNAHCSLVRSDRIDASFNNICFFILRKQIKNIYELLCMYTHTRILSFKLKQCPTFLMRWLLNNHFLFNRFGKANFSHKIRRINEKDFLFREKREKKKWKWKWKVNISSIDFLAKKQNNGTTTNIRLI